MKNVLTCFFAVLLGLLSANQLNAQSQQMGHVVQIKSHGGKKITGPIAKITSDSVYVVRKNAHILGIAYTDMQELKVFKRHRDIAYTLITTGLATGAIIAAQTLHDGNVATLVGIGGSVAIIAVSMLLHNAIHGPELKLLELNYQLAKEKLTPYLVNKN